MQLDSPIHAFDFTSEQQSWLTDPSSLTRKLREHSQQIEHALHFAGWGTADPKEQQWLNMLDSNGWVREIEWRQNQTPLIIGRVVIPKTSINTETQVLTEIGTQSLGSTLFKDSTLQRSDFIFSAVHPDDFYYQLAQRACPGLSESLIARSSIFTFKHQPLLVSEIFLPGFFQATC